jgi:hypothetical protein
VAQTQKKPTPLSIAVHASRRHQNGEGLTDIFSAAQAVTHSFFEMTGINGRFRLLPDQKRKGSPHHQGVRVQYVNEEKNTAKIAVQPNDNNTCWTYWLTPLDGTSIKEVAERVIAFQQRLRHGAPEVVEEVDGAEGPELPVPEPVNDVGESLAADNADCEKNSQYYLNDLDSIVLAMEFSFSEVGSIVDFEDLADELADALKCSGICAQQICLGLQARGHLKIGLVTGTNKVRLESQAIKDKFIAFGFHKLPQKVAAPATVVRPSKREQERQLLRDAKVGQVIVPPTRAPAQSHLRAVQTETAPPIERAVEAPPVRPVVEEVAPVAPSVLGFDVGTELKTLQDRAANFDQARNTVLRSTTARAALDERRERALAEVKAVEEELRQLDNEREAALRILTDASYSSAATKMVEFNAKLSELHSLLKS